MIITSTADVLAVIGGATTFCAALFAAVRLSRCQTVTCCWGCIDLKNKPIPTVPVPANTPTLDQPTLEKSNSIV